MKIFLRISLILGFILICAVIIVPLLAQMQFEAGKGYEKALRVKTAAKKYALAAKLAPFDSEYIAALGRVTKSKQDIERAIALNPREAQYWVDLAGLTSSPTLMMRYLRKALENDPYGFNISLQVAYVGYKKLDRLNKDDRELILEKMKYCLDTRPRYKKYFKNGK